MYKCIIISVCSDLSAFMYEYKYLTQEFYAGKAGDSRVKFTSLRH